MPGLSFDVCPASVYFSSRHTHPQKQRPPIRTIFFALPYVCPKNLHALRTSSARHGTLRDVAAGEVAASAAAMRTGLLLLEEGVCTYFVAGSNDGALRRSCRSFFPHTLWSMTSKRVGRRLRRQTRAIPSLRCWCTAPNSMKGTSSRIQGSPSKGMAPIAQAGGNAQGIMANLASRRAARGVLLKAVLLHEHAGIGSDWMRSMTSPQGGETRQPHARRSHRQSETGARAGLARRVGRHLEVLPTLFDDIYNWLKTVGGCLRRTDSTAICHNQKGDSRSEAAAPSVIKPSSKSLYDLTSSH